MRSLRNEYLILLSVIAGMILIGLVLFFVLSSLLRQEPELAPTPAAASEGNLQTRVAQVFEQTPTVLPDPNTIIHDIRTLARLETIQYTVEKVIRVEQGQESGLGFLFGDKLLFVGHGQVIAGIDLARMRPEDMRVDGGVLYVRLPEPEVFVTTLDNDKSYVYNRDTGLLTKGNIDLERTARAAAEEEILKAAVEDGILTQAQQNAENYMSRMLRGLGYPEVIFINDGTPVPPAEGAPAAGETPVPTLPALTEPAP